MRACAKVGAYAGVVALVALSAIITKQARHDTGLSALAELDHRASVQPVAAAAPAPAESDVAQADAPAGPETPARDDSEEVPGKYWPADTRWFNGRPVRPARTIWMTVTAYSPDQRSCGRFADGQTASLHSVWTNDMHLVAADSSVLPLGSMISVPGYDDGDVVPVLDRGGAIKGYRLDVLYPTHAIARQWGVQRIPVTVWEYADGLPPDDFRAIRDSRN